VNPIFSDNRVKLGVMAFNCSHGSTVTRVPGWTEGMVETQATLIAENIDRAARGEPPVNEIAPAA